MFEGETRWELPGPVEATVTPVKMRMFCDVFLGVEPEPFEMGEHLIEASGKLSLLDNLLTFLLKEQVSSSAGGEAPPSGCFS